MIYYTESENQTKELGKKFAANLKGGDIVTLDGDLGAGKTVFAKGIALGLGVKEQVISPTFMLMKQYEGKKYKLNHFDMYRIEGSQLNELGLDEFIGTPDSIAIIEWADNISNYLKKPTYKIKIYNKTNDNKRQVEIL